jgi:DNA-binding CsgD family transcriptional regulator
MEGIEKMAKHLNNSTRETIEQQLLEGLNNREIGDICHVTEKTVKWHMTSILKQYGCKSRYEYMAMKYKEMIKDLKL